MAAVVHVVSGPAGSGKTRSLLAAASEVRGDGPGATLWLAPTMRRALAVQAMLGAAEVCNVLVRTFDQMAGEIVARHDPRTQPLSRAQRRLILDAVVTELHDRKQLTHFGRVVETRGFAEGAAGLIEELKRQAVTPDDFALVARQAKERECGRLYEGYEKRLRELHRVDAEGALRRAGELLIQGRIAPFDGVRTLLVDDFCDFTPAQLNLLDAIRLSVGELWIALPDEVGESRAELFSRSRQTLAALMAWSPRLTFLPRGGEVEKNLTPPAPLPEAGRGEQTSSPSLRFGEGVRGWGSARRPFGLAHLERSLFLPVRAVKPSADAEGVALIEAPGALGEVRLVARRIKELMLGGVTAEEVLVVARDILPYADLIIEVFGEYGIPVDVEGAEPIMRNPAVGVLLRALRLPDDDWPFASVTALLRSSYCRPSWRELEGDPERPREAEALLRLLGEPRGRDAYLTAVRRWAEKIQPGLEDEQAQESRRRRTHELAHRCRSFLDRFFRAWDAMPLTVPLNGHVAWLREFVADLGLGPAAAAERDTRCWERFWDEIDHWERREGLESLDRRTFLRRLNALAVEAGVARTPHGPGRVRVLSAPLARTLEADHLFLLGMGERGFPQLAMAASLIDEGERQRLRGSGLDLRGQGDQLPDEMLLFYQVVTRARRRLTLSYPAVDERGQDLLPGAFLNAVLDCFTPDAIPHERRRMLIEGHDRDRPLSPAEYRVRAAAHRQKSPGLTDDLAANLAAAFEIALQRRQREFSPWDGMFRDPAIVAEVQRLFSPDRVFSPTALEEYVACPFRFFLGQVLRLEPLDEPREEIEMTRRGQAVHRALSRLHQRLKDEETHTPCDAIEAVILEEFNRAILEDVERAPGPASKVLWEIEGERLLRVAARYRGQWEAFLKPWGEVGVAPRPHHFEIDFGMLPENGAPASPPLVVSAEDVEVRISGRIDRVDVAEIEDGLGFWIIDYKTGNSNNYTSPDLERFERLQLTLYALAVEDVLMSEKGARPLGLAYWMIGENGPKVVVVGKDKTNWLKRAAPWQGLRQTLREWVLTLARNIRSGVFPLRPRSEHCSATCQYAQVCRITQSRHVERSWTLELPILPVGEEVARSDDAE